MTTEAQQMSEALGEGSISLDTKEGQEAWAFIEKIEDIVFTASMKLSPKAQKLFLKELKFRATKVWN